MSSFAMAFAEMNGDLLAIQQRGTLVTIWNERGPICEVEQHEFQGLIEDDVIEPPEMSSRTVEKLTHLTDRMTADMQPNEAIPMARKILARD